MPNVRFIGFVNTIVKVKYMFSMKDPIPESLKSFAVYKFVCAGCNAYYLGETTCHLSASIKEHLETNKKSHIFTHLFKQLNYKALSSENSFEIIDSASTPFRSKLKEAMYIFRKKPSLSKHQKHINISIIVQSSFIFNYYLHFILPFPFIPSSVLLSF